MGGTGHRNKETTKA